VELHSFARDRRGNDRVGKPVIDVDEAMGEVTDRVDQSQRGERGRLCFQARPRYRAALSGDRREMPESAMRWPVSHPALATLVAAEQRSSARTETGKK
jgi:hypothetical protein